MARPPRPLHSGKTSAAPRSPAETEKLSPNSTHISTLRRSHQATKSGVELSTKTQVFGECLGV